MKNLRNMQLFKSLMLITFSLAFVCVNAQKGDDPAQKVATSKTSFQKQYEQNIRKTRINGVYIPADMEEAFEELNTLSEGEGVAKFKQAPEEVIARKLHFGLGRWISVNWNLEEGSRYEYYLRQLGLSKVDDMVQFTIVSWHRSLLNKDLEIEKRVAEYKAKLEQELAARRGEATLIKSEIKKIEKSE